MVGEFGLKKLTDCFQYAPLYTIFAGGALQTSIPGIWKGWWTKLCTRKANQWLESRNVGLRRGKVRGAVGMGP